jgi:hypothetical protein
LRPFPDPDPPVDRPDPLTEYRRRFQERDRACREAEGESALLADLRLAAGGLGLVIGVLALTPVRLSPWWLLIPLLVFAGLVLVHRRANRRAERARLACEHYDQGLRRLEHRWAGTGRSGIIPVPADHPFAIDLDLFGPGSLFELLCTARTETGAERLAEWLLEPAPPEEVARRQEGVRELSDRLDLREELTILAGGTTPDIPSGQLRRWAATRSGLTPSTRRRLRIGGLTGSLLLLGGLFTWDLGAGPLIFWTALFLAWGIDALARRRLAGVRADLERARMGLRALARLTDRIEAEAVGTPRLLALRAALTAEGRPASRAVARLDRLCGWLDSTRNMLFAPFAFLFFLPLHLTLAVEGWRRRCGPRVAGWLDALGDWEALEALSAYHWEHPDDPFPEPAEAGMVQLEADGLGHPLLDPAVCVRNEVHLTSPAPACLLVSGSNMSGKSTLLRTVGINVVLARAGAPVRAHRMQLAPLRVGATIHIEDSLQDGRSRFYTEIERLHRITEAATREPLLFLLDEILHGTNSHDRRIGSAVVVRGLLEAGAIGLVTTHDLALAGIEEDLPGRVANVHFEDRLEDGRLVFDYRLRPGVVHRGNALELMRGLGFTVPEVPEEG